MRSRIISAMLALLAPAIVQASTKPRPAAQREVLPFIENDYPKALAEARSRKVPIFIEAWAPW
jgi:hypothetical protein